MLTTKTKTTVTVRTEVRMEINRPFLIEMLEAQGHKIPAGADIYVQVPGGGDWSNTSLEVDHENPIIVTWTEIDEKVNQG